MGLAPTGKRRLFTAHARTGLMHCKNGGEALRLSPAGNIILQQKERGLDFRVEMVTASRHPMENDRVPTPQTESQGSRPVGQVNAVSAALGGLIATAAALGIGRFVYTPICRP